MGIPKYIEQIGQEVERTLYQGIIVPSFMRDLFLDNSLKIIQTVHGSMSSFWTLFLRIFLLFC